jgi:hypothetical protein
MKSRRQPWYDNGPIYVSKVTTAALAAGARWITVECLLKHAPELNGICGGCLATNNQSVFAGNALSRGDHDHATTRRINSQPRDQSR